MPEHKQSVHAELKSYHGVPTIHMDGVPDPGLAYMTYWPKSQQLREFGEAGVHLYSVPSTCCQHLWEPMAPQVWISPNGYEYSHVDRLIEQIVTADPEARIFPRVYLNSPRWWDAMHPDQLVMVDDGNGVPIPYYERNQKRVPSWASEVWRRDTAESLRQYIAHIQQSPYAKHVIGYHIASGTTEEWMYWGANDGAYADFSTPTLERFKVWLRERYCNDVAQLRAAWNDPAVDFDRVTIPTKAERLSTELMFLRDPQREGKVIDFFRYNSWMTADTICGLAKVISESTERRAFCGVFYGYILQLASHDQRWQNAGHLGLKYVLESPDIDFFCSPSHYSARNLGPGGYSMFMSLTDSIKLHGKTWFDENDYRTCVATSEGWGKTYTMSDTIAIERRELANVLSNGVCMWWFNLGSEPWFSHPELLAEIAHHRQIGQRSLEWDRSSVSEIGVLVDEDTICQLQLESDLPEKLIIRQLPELGRLGAPHSLYLLDDLELLSGDEHKLWIMLNTFATTARQRELIRTKLQRSGHTILWLYAPSIIADGKLSPETMVELTGINIQYLKQTLPLLVAPEGAAVPIYPQYGIDKPIGPVFYAADPQAEVWGTLLALGVPGLVAKQMPEWRSVYSAAPCLPSALLRRIAQGAGVHIYSDQNDIIYANRQFIGVCVDNGGTRTISLPQKSDVYDLLADTTIATGVSEFTIDLPARQTGLYHVVPNQTAQGE
ncbi:MAG: hypothetical protein ACYCZF_06485 [Anaerolineae bacterium]